MKVTCKSCQLVLKVPDSYVGKRGKCPKCGEIIDIQAAPVDPVGSSCPPATKNQKEYARSLGIDFPSDINRSDISKLIDKVIEKRDTERFLKAEQLQNKESEYYEEIRNEILAEVDEEDCRLSKADISQMLEELSNRDEGAILITFPMDEIDFDNIEGTKLSVSFSDNLTDSQMRALIVGLGMAIKRQVGL